MLSESCFDFDPRRPLPKREYRRAYQAIRELTADSSKTGKAIEVGEALMPNRLASQFTRFLSHPLGRALARTRPSLLEALTKLKPSSSQCSPTLGDAYLDHIGKFNLSPEKLIQLERARLGDKAELESDLWWFTQRLALIHDIWHALTGYGGDGPGEFQLLWFTWAQNREPMFFWLGCGALLFGDREREFGRLKRVRIARQAARAGRRAHWLLPLPYEELLDQPVYSLREVLRIDC